MSSGPDQIQPGEGALPQLAEYPEVGRNAHPGVASGALARSRETLSNFSADAVGKAKDAFDRTQQVATGLAQSALEKSGEAIGGARDAVGQTASSLMERTNEMATRSKRAVTTRATNAGSSIGQLAREQPLLVAGVGFALGVALGALLPLTRQENELLGEQASRLKDSASELAMEGYEKAKVVAQKTYDSALESLKTSEEGGGSASSGQKENTNYGADNGGDTGSTAYRH
jgi:ElaB/YqjD/DUF883 family membrane-anchored ribosome-binding protein